MSTRPIVGGGGGADTQVEDTNVLSKTVARQQDVLLEIGGQQQDVLSEFVACQLIVLLEIVACRQNVLLEIVACQQDVLSGSADPHSTVPFHASLPQARGLGWKLPWPCGRLTTGKRNDLGPAGAWSGRRRGNQWRLDGVDPWTHWTGGGASESLVKLELWFGSSTNSNPTTPPATAGGYEGQAAVTRCCDPGLVLRPWGDFGEGV